MSDSGSSESSVSESAGSVVVIGGGLIGLASAHYLAERGCAVTVVDRERIGAACSHGNCGLISPSHVLPLAEPGAIRTALKSLLDRDSPFRVKPRFDPALWSWMWHFARRCNEKDMIAAGFGIRALLASSRELFAHLVPNEPLPCEWQENGLLFAFATRKGFEEYAATNDLLAERFDEPARRVEPDELVAMEPALKDGLGGAWFYEEDAHLRPDKLVASWRTRLTERGVTFVENCEVKRIERGDGRATKLVSTTGEFTADTFVVATGALTPKLSEWLGCRIPIQPGKGYSITMPRPAHCPRIPMLLPEHRVAVTPMETGYRLGSIMEFAGYDSSIDPRRVALLRRGAERYLREPYCDPVEETWYGWRPMTYDSTPIIDRLPSLSNVVIAAGHNMLGLSMAPATGKLVAELVAGAEPHVDPEPYRVTRF